MSKAGEFVPIFYRKDRLTLRSVEHFWLSETPDVPGSISWCSVFAFAVLGRLYQDVEQGRGTDENGNARSLVT
jgi:hypothetical protein